MTTKEKITEVLNEQIVSVVEFSKDNYKLISFGTIQANYVIEINGIRQPKTIKRLSKELKEFFKL